MSATCSIVRDKKVHFHPTKCTYQVSTLCILHCSFSYLNLLGEDKVSEVDIFRSCIALKKTATRATRVSRKRRPRKRRPQTSKTQTSKTQTSKTQTSKRKRKDELRDLNSLRSRAKAVFVFVPCQCFIGLCLQGLRFRGLRFRGLRFRG